MEFDVGASQIAEMRASTLNSIKDIRLVAIADTDELKAKKFASKYGINHVYSSLNSLLKDPKVDIIYIATPNNLHAGRR